MGTGKNLPLYPPGSDVTGIDFSPEMLKRAGARAGKLGLSVRLIETVGNVQKAGLKLSRVSNMKGDILKMIQARP